MHGAQVSDQEILRAVSVLKLVDQDGTEALLVDRQALGMLTEQREGMEQQIVEIHGVLGRERLVVHRKNLCCDALDGILGIGRYQQLQLVFRVRYYCADQTWWERLGGISTTFEQALDER